MVGDVDVMTMMLCYFRNAKRRRNQLKKWIEKEKGGTANGTAAFSRLRE